MVLPSAQVLRRCLSESAFGRFLCLRELHLGLRLLLGMDLNDDDLYLWRQTQRGDPDAFARIYAKHARNLTSFALRQTADPDLADDLASAVFLEVWQKRDRLRPTGGSVWPLLVGIATNQLHNRWRAKRRLAGAVKRLGSTWETETPSHEDRTIEKADALARIEGCRAEISNLPKREAEALAAVSFGQLTYEEAAEALDVPVGTIRSRISRARKRITSNCHDGAFSSLAPTTSLKGQVK